MLKNGLWYQTTDKMDGKMAGMKSLNTSPSCNPFCQSMQKVGKYICSSCYSNNTEKRWKDAKKSWENNFHVLSNHALEEGELVGTKAEIYRFSAHGDLGSRIHYENLVRIAEYNPKTTFALWTKNHSVIRQGGVIELPNLIHIYSTPNLNEPNPVVPDGFDRSFSVYTYDFAMENGIDVNCGAKNCLSCRLCYEHNDVEYVNEIIKSDHYKLKGGK